MITWPLSPFKRFFCFVGVDCWLKNKWTITLDVWHCQCIAANEVRYTFLLNGNRKVMSTIVAPNLTLNTQSTCQLHKTNVDFKASYVTTEMHEVKYCALLVSFSNFNLLRLYGNRLPRCCLRTVFALIFIKMLHISSKLHKAKPGWDPETFLYFLVKSLIH